MKAKGILIGALFALALAAPAKADPIFDVSSGLGLETNGIEFMNTLYEGYSALSEERTWVTDLTDGEHFNHKARTAARRSTVNPDEIMDRDLLDDDAKALAAALDRLRIAYDRGGRYLAPVAAGKAQVAYDCWIEAAEGAAGRIGLASSAEGRRKDAEKCRSDFETAMSTVESVSYFRLTEFRKPAGSPQMVETPTPAPMAAPKPFVIYFAWDSDKIDAAGMRIIDQAVAMAGELGIVDFSVTGHADRSGPEEYNLALSLRRANHVRDALVTRGIKAGGISVAGRGEAEPAVPTADGVREPANRRVEIIFL